MQQYQTVFLFTEKATPFLVSHILTIGGGLLVALITLSYVRRAMRRNETIEPRILVLILLGLVFASIQGISLYFFLIEYLPLRQAYINHTYQITEGQVHVRSTQPVTGHAPGDSIVIGERVFTIDYFTMSPGYTQTIAHQGILTEGVNARILSYGESILRIDVK